MQIDVLSPVPSYMQLVALLRADIEARKLPPRAPLPSIAELAFQTALSQGTVRHALEVLKRDGFIVGIPGRGHYVA